MTDTFTISAAAAARVQELLTLPDYAGRSALRVAIEGGGCSGFQYSYDLVNSPAPDDHVILAHGVQVLVDPISLQYLSGATLDYESDLSGNRWVMKNPNATARCGCGSSFSV